MARVLSAGQLSTDGHAESGGDSMTSLNSALYKGRVRHTRLEPFHHQFEYRVFYGLFDIDELDQVDEGLRLFSTGRFNLFGLDISDHGPADGGPLREWVEENLAEAGIDLEGGKILLLAFPRLLGYVFNPLSVWYCHGPDGDLRAVIHEVMNTFGDRHSYVVPVGSQGLSHTFAKELHVSPFNAMDQDYRFSISEPGERLTVTIDQRDSKSRFFRAGMNLTRLPLNDRNLIRLFLTNPLLTLKVVVGIHWQAFRLWSKGAQFHPRPEPSTRNLTIVGDRSQV